MDEPLKNDCVVRTLERWCLKLTGLKGGRMLELGAKANAGGTYKDYFVGLGWEHVSIDLNGEDGSLVRDLSYPDTLADLGQFDVVTNYGTTEHVTQQEPCWENVHKAIKPGGWIVSLTPAPGTWVGHGMWYPYLDWYGVFGILNHYFTTMTGVFPGRAPTGEIRRTNGYVAQKQGEKAFTMPPADLMRHNDEGHIGDYSARFIVHKEDGQPARVSKYQELMAEVQYLLPEMNQHETAAYYLRTLNAVAARTQGK